MLTRRTATVTISAPDASTAAAFCSKSLIFAGADDQPRAKVRPATVQVSARLLTPRQRSARSHTRRHPRPALRRASSAARSPVALDRDPLGIEPELGHQLGERGAAGDPAMLAVDAYLKGPVSAHGCGADRKLAR